MMKFALARTPSVLARVWVARSTVTAISMALGCSLAGSAHAQLDAKSSKKLCLSLLDLGATADAVEFVCNININTGGSRGVVAEYNQGGCNNIIPEQVRKRHLTSIAKIIMARKKLMGRSRFCAGSAELDLKLKQDHPSE